MARRRASLAVASASGGRLGDVAACGECGTGERERNCPGEQDGAACCGGEEVLGGEADEGVLGVGGCEAADGGDEGEEEVLGDEAPGE